MGSKQGRPYLLVQSIPIDWGLHVQCFLCFPARLNLRVFEQAILAWEEAAQGQCWGAVLLPQLQPALHRVLPPWLPREMPQWRLPSLKRIPSQICLDEGIFFYTVMMCWSCICSSSGMEGLAIACRLSQVCIVELYPRVGAW